MKKTLFMLLSFVMFSSLAASSCYAATKSFGEEIVNRKITPIKDILANPKAYEGKTVTIEGKIASECPSGCWFYVKVEDNNVAIYVDIGKSGFAIPQYTGKKVLVEGTVVMKGPAPMIQGKGVEIK